MLPEIAIADAYGAGFEFSSRKKIDLHNHLSQYLPHELYEFVGRYTDDTQMSIALAELLMSEDHWTRETIAGSFVHCFQRDRRKGYSNGFYNALSKVKSGSELLAAIDGRSTRNGAAMRSVPLGFIKAKRDVVRMASMQASTTHDTKRGVRSSCAVALAAHYGLQMNGRVTGLKRFLDEEGFGDWNFDWRGEVTTDAYETLSAAFSCLLRFRNLADLLQESVALGGDTDSVASIAVGLATCFVEYDMTLPPALQDKLDEPLYGLEFLRGLDRKLFEKYVD